MSFDSVFTIIIRQDAIWVTLWICIFYSVADVFSLINHQFRPFLVMRIELFYSDRLHKRKCWRHAGQAWSTSQVSYTMV